MVSSHIVNQGYLKGVFDGFLISAGFVVLVLILVSIALPMPNVPTYVYGDGGIKLDEAPP